jgi:VanZ family protein
MTFPDGHGGGAEAPNPDDRPPRAGSDGSAGRSWRPVLRRAPAPLALMALIFYLSSQSDPGPDLAPALRMLAHAAEFGLLTLLWAWALGPRLGPRRAIPSAAAIALAYAISDEYHQTFVPGRDGNPVDVAIDAAGIAIAALALVLRLRAARTRARRERSRAASPRGSRPAAPRDEPGTRLRA